MIPVAMGVVAALIAAAWWIRRRYVLVTIEGNSMLPSFEPGDRVLVRRVGTETLRRGQVVVAALPAEGAQAEPGVTRLGGSWMIKRIAALPGDPVAGYGLAEPQGDRVLAGKLVLLGDNPDASHDSRRLGYFDAADLLGVVVRRVGHR